MEVTGSDKHTSLLGHIINCICSKFYATDYKCHSNKTFTSSVMMFELLYQGQSHKTFLSVNFLLFLLARSFHYNAIYIVSFIKWSSLQESVITLCRKKFGLCIRHAKYFRVGPGACTNVCIEKGSLLSFVYKFGQVGHQSC